MRISHLLVGVAAAASIAVLGCGETVIDSSKVEKSIGRTVIDQAGVHVKSVSCPKDPKAKKGATFTCTVIAKAGEKFRCKASDGKVTRDIEATMTNDEGNFTAKIV